MAWIPYAIVAALGVATADFCVKLAAEKVPTSIGLVCYGGCSFLAGLVWLLIERGNGDLRIPEVSGWIPALGVGVAFTVVTICMYTAFRIGAPISLASPAIRIAGLTLASLAGILILKEPINLQFFLGGGLAVSGIFLLVTR
jgi:transporter family protein